MRIAAGDSTMNQATIKHAPIWEKQEAGWYTSNKGGISKESNGWYFFPSGGDLRRGPFKTLKAAMQEAEQ
jgi:hypothetical protein